MDAKLANNLLLPNIPLNQAFTVMLFTSIFRFDHSLWSRYLQDCCGRRRQKRRHCSGGPGRQHDVPHCLENKHRCSNQTKVWQTWCSNLQLHLRTKQALHLGRASRFGQQALLKVPLWIHTLVAWRLLQEKQSPQPNLRGPVALLASSFRRPGSQSGWPKAIPHENCQ